MVFLLIQICNSPRVLYFVNGLATMAKVFKEIAQQQMEGCSGLSSLKTYDDIFFEYFVASAYSGHFDIVFKANILPTCDFFKDRLVSQTRPFFVFAVAPIAYQI